MKYKQQYLALKKDLDIQIELKQKYQNWWRESRDRNLKHQNTILDLSDKIKHLENSKLKLEVDLLKKIVSLHERQPSAPEVNYVDSRIQNNRWSSANTPNVATSSSTPYV